MREGGPAARLGLREADLLVFPTYYRNEGHPWVIVEALAATLTSRIWSGGYGGVLDPPDSHKKGR